MNSKNGFVRPILFSEENQYHDKVQTQEILDRKGYSIYGLNILGIKQ